MELTFTSFNQQSCIHSHSEVITVPPFSQVSRSPYLMLPSWELQGGDQPPLLPIGVGVPDWGLAPGPYLILWPILVSWPILPVNSVGAWPSREWEWRSEREPGIPSDGAPPCSSQGSSAPTRPSHQSGGSRGGRGWNLTGASRNVAETSTREKKPHTWRVGELRFIMPVSPEELTLQALRPKQRGYRVLNGTPLQYSCLKNPMDGGAL